MLRSPQPIAPWQVYRFNFAMALSFLHRMTGVMLTLVVWAITLVWANVLPNPLAACSDCILARLAALCVVWMLAYHAANGVRHLIWDRGQWMELGTLKASGLLVCFASFAITWCVFYGWAQP